MVAPNQTARAKLIPPKNHNIYNKQAPATPENEFTQVLTNGVKKLMIKCRGNSRIRFTFASGESGTKYITIPAGCTYSVDNVDLQNKTLYMRCNTASEIVEIEEWF